jgi:hypothetical protein
MSDKRIFILRDEPHPSRKLAAAACATMPEGYSCTFAPPNRTLDQSAKFHAICGDIAKSGMPWAGKPRTAIQWKCLLVSGHAIATNECSDVIPGLEGEFINLRESTALMSKKRGSSLIEYTLAFCATNCIELNDEFN